MKRLLAIIGLLALSACSDDPQNVDNHVWKNQTDTIEQAAAAAKSLEQSMQLQKQTIEQNH